MTHVGRVSAVDGSSSGAARARRDRSERSWSRDGWAIAVVVAAFVVSRVAYHALGVGFNARPLEFDLQNIDVGLLRHDLFESVWYLHVQPPGWNLLIGLVLRWSPLRVSTSFHLMQLVFGFALVIGLYDLCRQLGLGRWVAAIVTIVVGCGPVIVLYENVLNYEYLMATIVVLLVDATARWVRNGHTGTLAALIMLAAAASLTRSLLHPVWFLGVVVLALLVRRPARWTWQPVVAVILPVLLVLGAVVKNEVLFGTPQLSSLFGVNLWHVTVSPLPPDVQHRLRVQGVLTAPPVPRGCKPSHPNVAVLANRFKSTHGPNWNWECSLAFYRSLERDAVAAARAEPARTAESVAGSWEIWAEPSTVNVSKNRGSIDGIETAYRRAVLLDVAWDPPVELGPIVGYMILNSPDRRIHLSITIVAATALVLAAGLWALTRWRRHGLSPARAALLMGAGTVAFVTVVGNFFDRGENNRFRFIVEPLTLVLTVAVVAALVRAAQARAGAARPSAAGGTTMRGHLRRRPAVVVLIVVAAAELGVAWSNLVSAHSPNFGGLQPGATVSTLGGVVPNSAARGTTLSLSVTGSGFLPGARVVVGGDGVIVNGVAVVDGSRLMFNVTVSRSAPIGPRNVVVLSSQTSAGVSAGAVGVCTKCLVITSGVTGR